MNEGTQKILERELSHLRVRIIAHQSRGKVLRAGIREVNVKVRELRKEAADIMESLNVT